VSPHRDQELLRRTDAGRPFLKNLF